VSVELPPQKSLTRTALGSRLPSVPQELLSPRHTNGIFRLQLLDELNARAGGVLLPDEIYPLLQNLRGTRIGFSRKTKPPGTVS
jgi:hypothetical protein